MDRKLINYLPPVLRDVTEFKAMSHRRKGKRTVVFFCHPYSAFERGSNENMNRLIRRFFPKGTNFDNVTREEVMAAERWVNNYPRKILGWKSASMLFDQELQAA